MQHSLHVNGSPTAMKTQLINQSINQSKHISIAPYVASESVLIVLGAAEKKASLAVNTLYLFLCGNLISYFDSYCSLH